MYMYFTHFVKYRFGGHKNCLLSHLLKLHEVFSLHFPCYFSSCNLLLLAKNGSANHEPGKESYHFSRRGGPGEIKKPISWAYQCGNFCPSGKPQGLQADMES